MGWGRLHGRVGCSGKKAWRPSPSCRSVDSMSPFALALNKYHMDGGSLATPEQGPEKKKKVSIVSGLGVHGLRFERFLDLGHPNPEP